MSGSTTNKLFECANKKVLLMTIIISSVIPGLIALWVYPFIFDRIGKYPDFVTGATTWSGYFKRGDTILFYVFFVSYFLLLAGVPVLLNRLLKSNPGSSVISGTPVNPGSIIEHKVLNLLFSVIFGVLVFLVYSKIMIIIVLLFIICLFIIMESYRGSFKNAFSRFCLLGIFGYFNIIILSIIIASVFDYSKISIFLDYTQNYIAILLAAGILSIAYVFTEGRINETTVKKLFSGFQIALPVLLIVIYQFRYYRNGVYLTQFHSDGLMYICWGAAAGLILLNLYEYRRNVKGETQKSLIHTATFISVPAFVIFNIPQGSLLTDFFHTGEHTTTLQQLFQFGSIPYIDYYPIHGLYNYTHGLLNYVFYNGEYATYAASSAIFTVAGGIIISLLIKRFCEGEAFPFLLAVLVAAFGADSISRFFGVFILILILHNRSLRENPFTYLRWWITTTMIAVLWNPPLGSVAAISFLPLLILSFTDKKGNLREYFIQEKSNKKALIAWGIPVLAGICLIPVFINMISYMLINFSVTSEANGVSLTDAILHGELISADFSSINMIFTLLIRPLGFMFAVILLICMKFENKKNSNLDTGAVLQVLIYSLLISGYTLVRADNDFLRVMWSNRALFLALSGAIGGYLFKNRNIYKSSFLIPVMLAVALGGTVIDLFNQHEKFFDPPSIGYDHVQFNGSAAGIDNLGTVYVDQYHARQLVNLNHILSETDEYLDWTVNVANHTIFGKRSPVPTSSMYNTQTRNLQYKYIQSINDNPPEVILISPQFLHDGGTAAFRAYPVWRWAVSKGYSPYIYRNTAFLLSEDSPGKQTFRSAENEFSELMHIKNLGFLPLHWGSEEIINNRLLPSGVPLTRMADNNIENGSITSDDSYILYKTGALVRGIDNDFLKVVIRSEIELLDEGDFQIYWANETGEFSEKMSFLFRGSSDVMLIPLGTSPSWIYSDDLTYIRFDFPYTMEGKEAPHVELMFYVYNDIG